MKRLEKCYQKDTQNIIPQIINGEVVLIPIRNNIGDLDSIYTLDKVGGRIWELIDGKKTINQISTLISNEFEGVSKNVSKDIIDFLKQLENIKAVKLS